jgi:hypothetical protein
LGRRVPEDVHHAAFQLPEAPHGRSLGSDFGSAFIIRFLFYYYAA